MKSNLKFRFEVDPNPVPEGERPYSVVRPSGVVSAVAEPLPGWVDAYLLVEPLIEGRRQHKTQMQLAIRNTYIIYSIHICILYTYTIRIYLRIEIIIDDELIESLRCLLCRFGARQAWAAVRSRSSRGVRTASSTASQWTTCAGRH